MLKFDPEYFEDFWTVPGYLGADPPESLVQARVQHKTTVVSPIFAERGAGARACRCRWRWPGAPRPPTCRWPSGWRRCRTACCGASCSSSPAARPPAGPLLRRSTCVDDIVIVGRGGGPLRGRRGIVAGRRGRRSTTPCTSRSRPTTATRCTPTTGCGTSSPRAASRSTRSGRTRSAPASPARARARSRAAGSPGR